MSTVIKMRVARASKYDAGGQDINEVQLVSSDRDGAQLEPDVVKGAGLQGSFVAPMAAELAHDALVDVTITASAPVGLVQP